LPGSEYTSGKNVVGDEPKPRETESMGDTGPEHIQKSPEKQKATSAGGAESGAVLPSALIEIIEGWSRVPAALQGAILAIVRSSR
jgi:hypothetical protein